MLNTDPKQIRTESEAVEYLAGRINIALELLPAVCLEPEAFGVASEWPDRFAADVRQAIEHLQNLAEAVPRIRESLLAMEAAVTEIQRAWTNLLRYSLLTSDELNTNVQSLIASYDTIWDSLHRLAQITGVRSETFDRQAKKRVFQRRTLEKLHLQFQN